MPPFNEQHARRLLDRMRLRPMLDGLRGAPAVDVQSFCEVASRFSSMIHELRDVVSEVDVNPVIVNEKGAIAVDALIVGRDRREPGRADA